MGSSQRLVCRVLGVARSRLSRRPTAVATDRRAPDPALVERIRFLIQANPVHGYRQLTAWLRNDGVMVNRKRVYRVLKLKGWLVHQRAVTPRPRVHGMVSRAKATNQRWAMDVTHIPCGRRLGAPGRGHRLPRPRDRRLRVRPPWPCQGGRAGARGGLPQAFRHPPAEGPTPIVRSDNGLIFQSRRFRAACKDYRLQPGVHHALHARAERHHRALLPHPQGGVCLAAQLHRFHPRTKGGHRLDSSLQHPAPALGPRLQEPHRVPRPTRTQGGLT